MDILTPMIKSSLSNIVVSHAINKPKVSLTRALIDCQDRDGYATLLLDEYKSLVETLSQLDDRTFSALQNEISSAIDQLVTWFSSISSNNTLSIYSTIRNLKQKALREKAKNKNATEKETANISFGKMLMNCEYV